MESSAWGTSRWLAPHWGRRRLGYALHWLTGIENGRRQQLRSYRNLVIPAIVATSLSIRCAAQAPNRMDHLLMAGVFLGMGEVVMHYLGMYGLKINGYVQWNYGLVALSIVIAVVAATAGLWQAFNSQSIAKRLAAAVIMGIAVCATHYTGILAAEFNCTVDTRQAIPQGFGYIRGFELPSLVIVTTFTIGIILSAQQWMQAFGGRAAVAKASRV